MSNTLTITGNLGQDPELRFTPNGDAVCNVSIADTPRRQNQAGEWEDAGETLWISVSVWREAGQALADAAKKGDKVTATGRLTIRSYDRQDGTRGSSLELTNATVAIVPKPARDGSQLRQSAPAQQQSRPVQQPRQQAPAQQRQEPQQQGWPMGTSSTHGEPPF